MDVPQNDSAPSARTVEGPPAPARAQPIDYATPRVRKPRSWPFWLAFAFAYLPGMFVLGIADDVVHRQLTGNPSDGGIVFLGLYCFPVVALLAVAMRATSSRCRTPGFAATFAIAAPLLLYLAWVSVYLLTR